MQGCTCVCGLAYHRSRPSTSETKGKTLPAVSNAPPPPPPPQSEESSYEPPPTTHISNLTLRQSKTLICLSIKASSVLCRKGNVLYRCNYRTYVGMVGEAVGRPATVRHGCVLFAQSLIRQHYLLRRRGEGQLRTGTGAALVHGNQQHIGGADFVDTHRPKRCQNNHYFLQCARCRYNQSINRSIHPSSKQ